MGDRANILVKDGAEDSGVYLYSHWGGSELPEVLKTALSRKQRWNDPAYLTRIIFDEMTMGQQGNETGYGISAFLGDGEERILEVNCTGQTVKVRVHGHADRVYTFSDYAALDNPQWRREE